MTNLLSTLLLVAVAGVIAPRVVVAKNPVAVVKTNMGTFKIEFYPDDAPKTVKNFVGLAKKKFFDTIRFHRVIKGFVIQGGDPKSKDASKMSEWGTGGESIYGGEFEDELNPQTASYKAGYGKYVVAMANHGPNTNSSQFFVMCGSQLPHSYTIFGKVTTGTDVIDRINNVETIRGVDRPKQDVIMEQVTIE
jgi:cyclophilin family peptidyl-prolyl cis-trans isomerase